MEKALWLIIISIIIIIIQFNQRYYRAIQWGVCLKRYNEKYRNFT